MASSLARLALFEIMAAVPVESMVTESSEREMDGKRSTEDAKKARNTSREKRLPGRCPEQRALCFMDASFFAGPANERGSGKNYIAYLAGKVQRREHNHLKLQGNLLKAPWTGCQGRPERRQRT